MISLVGLWSLILTSLISRSFAELSTQCQVEFVSYQSAPMEAKWIDNVENWQNEVCEHTPDSDIHLWLDNVADFHKPSANTVLETTTAAVPDNAWKGALSSFTHRRSCTISNGKATVTYVHTPIEPTASIVRDPRKCWEQLTETYTQSKAYLVPLSGDGRRALSGELASSSRSFLFDAGI